MKSWSRPLGFVAAITVIALAYFIGRSGRDDNAADAATAALRDPGYAALDAVVVETGFDGKERYRLNAKVIRQQMDSEVIDLEGIEMNYHSGPQAADAEQWCLKSDRGQVREAGDEVQLQGNVLVTGQAPGSGAPLSMSTETLRINTPTEFIETDAPVKLIWSGHRIDAVGMQADLKAGTLRLESKVHAVFVPQ